MDIGFVFTNFNNSHFTEGAVLSILGSDAGYAPIVIVDNASKVEHVAALRVIEERYENVKVIYNKKNIGYFKGLNVGINYAKIHLKLPLYWFVGNNDLIFPKNLYSQILACKGVLDKYPVVSPNIITVDGVYQNPHVITKISKVREFIYDIYYFNYFLAGAIRQIAKLTHKFTDRDDELQHDVSQEIYQGYGACYILTPTFFQNFDELWSPTFLMYEEFFLSKQLEAKGFKTYYESAITVRHHWHATTAELPKRFYWELSRDAHKEYRKHVKFWY